MRGSLFARLWPEPIGDLLFAVGGYLVFKVLSFYFEVGRQTEQVAYILVGLIFARGMQQLWTVLRRSSRE
jgi:hypothetical protein